MLMSYFCVYKLWVFAIEDRHLIKCLQVSNGHGATSLCKMFLDNGQTMEYWWSETFK